MSKQRYSSEDRAEEKAILDSLKVSSYKDQILEAIINKTDVKTHVPQYGTGNTQMCSNESNSLFSMDSDYMAEVAASALGVRGVTSALQGSPSIMKYAENQPHQEQESPRSSQPQQSVSGRQWKAIQKYPALVEFLGTDDAEPIVKHIAEKVNELLVVKIEKNSHSISKFAQACVADRHNLKQYFVGPDNQWVCCVIASGPFRGDEAIYFDKDRSKCAVVRLIGKKYEDVSDRFDIVHEYAESNSEVSNA